MIDVYKVKMVIGIMSPQHFVIRLPSTTTVVYETEAHQGTFRREGHGLAWSGMFHCNSPTRPSILPTQRGKVIDSQDMHSMTSLTLSERSYPSEFPWAREMLHRLVRPLA